MFESIKKIFFLKALRQTLATHQRHRVAFALKNAKTIGILFNAGNEKQRREVLTVAQSLEKQGKKVNLLGFVNAKITESSTSYRTFTRKELNWKGIPEGETVANFTKEKFNLLICFNPDTLLPLDWLAVMSNATMKTGMATPQPNDYDFQLEIPGSKPFQYFIEQLEFYLDKIILSKYEPAAAL
jgi:hypothetical protein